MNNLEKDAALMYTKGPPGELPAPDETSRATFQTFVNYSRLTTGNFDRGINSQPFPTAPNGPKRSQNHFSQYLLFIHAILLKARFNTFNRLLSSSICFHID